MWFFPVHIFCWPALWAWLCFAGCRTIMASRLSVAAPRSRSKRQLLPLLTLHVQTPRPNPRAGTSPRCGPNAPRLRLVRRG